MSIKEKNKTENLEADVVIIGGGTAGLSAAVAAVETEAGSVIVLEKRGSTGGNGAFAEGLFAAESDVQRRALIDASCDEIYKKTMKYHHYSRIDPKILLAYLRKSGDTIQWLEEKGVEFSIGTQNRLRFDQNPTWHIPKGRFGHVMKVLAQNCKDVGVQILLETSGEKILRNRQGKINGVSVVTKGGIPSEISAGSVIITTGGFAGNEELLKKYFPYYSDIFCSPGLPHMGDGIALASDVGAAVEDYATLLKESGYTTRTTRVIFSLLREPHLVCVNNRGERFIDEDALAYHPMEGGNVIIRQPSMIYYALFDDEIGKNMEKKGFLLGRPGVVRGSAGEPMVGLREELKADKYAEWVTISDSWDVIAEWIGADPKVLGTTIEKYNAYCDHGYDVSFIKERRYLVPLRTPPYYAVKIRPLMTDTIGPIRINERMEVLDNQSNPIGGLYAAGVVTSGWQSEEYCSEICGSAVGFSVNSGRIAGENAIKYALGK